MLVTFNVNVNYITNIYEWKFHEDDDEDDDYNKSSDFEVVQVQKELKKISLDPIVNKGQSVTKKAIEI